MYNYKKTILILAAVPVLSIKANAADWRLIPSIALSEIYTDNVDLDDNIQQSDFITQISPQISLTGSGPRLNVSLIYAPNYFYYPGDDDDNHDFYKRESTLEWPAGLAH